MDKLTLDFGAIDSAVPHDDKGLLCSWKIDLNEIVAQAEKANRMSDYM